MAYTDPTLTAGSTLAKRVHVTELMTALTNIKTVVTFPTAYNPTLSESNTTFPNITDIGRIRTAINGFESRFSGNCDCLENTDCCQTCQTTTCQSCQTTKCQSCQSTTCQSQSCQSCQTTTCQTTTCQTTTCQACQSCQSNSCQSNSCQSQCVVSDSH